jgi:LL-H family phage holin
MATNYVYDTSFITNILTQILQIVVLALVSYATAFIRKKLSNEKLKQVTHIASIGVKAAEEALNTESGAAKKRAVIEYLSKKTNLSTQDIDKLIDFTVFEMKKDIAAVNNKTLDTPNLKL